MRNLSETILLGLFIAITLGTVIALLKRERYCEVVMADGVSQGYLVAALENVTAFNFDGDITIVRNGEIKRTTCDRRSDEKP
jgi:hypothetical protein